MGMVISIGVTPSVCESIALAALSAVVLKKLVALFSERPVAPPPQVQRKAAQKKKSTSVIIEEARQELGVDCLNFYNFGVCGQSGVGKSSFINGILGLHGDDACTVGEVEINHAIKSYNTEKVPYLMVWEIPGAGTTNHPSNTYFEDKKLYVFDVILILSADRFLQVDFDILRLARKYETPCVFVRTKCDIGVERRARRDQVNALEASQRFREDVTSNFIQGLTDANLLGPFPTPDLFFISNYLFLDKDAYSIYDKKTKKVDTSLLSMDEDKLASFIYDTAKGRASQK